MPKIRNIIIFVSIALVIFLAYLFIINRTPEGPSLVTTASTVLPGVNNGAGSSTDTSVTSKNPFIAKDFLTLLLNVKNIKLEDSIFSDQAFLSLHDSSIVITPDGTEGRANPFAPLGNDPVSGGSTNNSVNTTQNNSVTNSTTTNTNTPTNNSIILPIKR